MSNGSLNKPIRNSEFNQPIILQNNITKIDNFLYYIRLVKISSKMFIPQPKKKSFASFSDPLSENLKNK